MKRRRTDTRRMRRVTDPLVQKARDVLLRSLKTAIRDLAASDYTLAMTVSGIQDRMTALEVSQREMTTMLREQLDHGLARHVAPIVGEQKALRADFVERFAEVAKRLQGIENGQHGQAGEKA